MTISHSWMHFMNMNQAMTFNQAKKEFRKNFLFDKTDKPAAGQAWCLFVDSLHREGRITDRQVNSWGNPFYK